MEVVHFERRSGEQNHSIERVFQSVRAGLPPQWTARTVQCPTPYHSPLWLLKGIFISWRERGKLNHIVGDIHYIAVGLIGRKSILTVHDLNRLHQLRGIRQVLYRYLYFTLPLRQCQAITTVSEATRSQLIREFPFIARKVVVILNPVPPEYRYQPKLFNCDTPLILQVGTAPNKNLDRVIEAIEGMSCILHIVGRLNGHQKKALLSAGIKYRNSVNISNIEMLQAYVASDLVIFASLCEGFGLPVIEANAVGRPVVTSSIEPMLSVAAGAACYVDPACTKSIRGGIIRVLRDSKFREDLVRLGEQNAKRFSAESIGKLYGKLYSEIAGCKE